MPGAKYFTPLRERLPMRKILLTATVIFSAIPALFAQISQADRLAVEKRAAELAAVIPAEPVHLLPPIADRAKWRDFADIGSGYDHIIGSAEAYLNKPVAELPEQLYKEYYTTGDRTNYENAWSGWRNRVMSLARGELVENKGRFLPALEEILRKICAHPSWSLPAHDYGAAIYDGKGAAADIIATELAGNLGLIVQAMRPVLSPDLPPLIEENIRRRVLDPLRAEIEGANNPMMSWVTLTNNWNTVCFCGSTAAALSVCAPAEERAWFLAAAEHFVTHYFFSGFSDDGYCSEGVGYWNYGFGHFAMLAELAWRASGTVNLYTSPKIRAAARYALKAEVAPGCYAAFADCPVYASPSETTLAIVSRRLGLGLTELEQQYGYPHCKVNTQILAAAYFFPAYDAGGTLPTLVPLEDEKPVDYLAEPVSFFPDAGVLICRPPKGNPDQIAAVFKGGTNAEHHNHNDLGTFGVLRGGVWLVVDPGGETYSKRTFSARRYEGELLSSFGHPVPRINGHLQTAGPEAAAGQLEFAPSETGVRYALDLSSAYPDSGAERVVRAYDYRRAGAEGGGGLTVTDTVTFAPGAAKEADFPLITFEEWTQIDERTIRITPRPEDDGSAGPGVTVTVTAFDENGAAVPGRFAEEIVGRDDPMTPNKPKRIAWQTELAEGQTLTVVTAIE